ncbi:hypothetical protein [Allorhizobium taibaishanense]|uniref:Uncharacterized protein n=1 Tax=Allorhizobium taibaishanense TaxID=887144 RepID=A0A1Q9A185_9HYPH|nr:hypothetical protein [Allorhizobium taibaishanense]MBB4008012.1 hypothetical protein [Allorhizobium taibaishanense]OLP48322.1 hypothetical protein BJF91_09355 [Allorhizobium taibaishanense]
MDITVDTASSSEDRPLISAGMLAVGVTLLVALALFTLALSFSSGWIGHALLADRRSESLTSHMTTIGLDRLRIEENAVRFERQRHDGVLSRVDLALLWPEMRGFSEVDRLRFDDIRQSSGLIFLQISQSTMSRDMSGRLEPIYKQLFEGDPEPGPYGLTAHRFRAGSGYDGEILYTATRPGMPDFAIRCLVNGGTKGQDDGPALDACQRDIHVGHDLSVLYRFSRQKLADWRRIDDAVAAFVNSRLVGDPQ